MTTPTTPNRKVLGGAAAALTIAVGFITAWEGSRTHAYFDSIGVATVCIGHTQGVHIGDVVSSAQCQAYLRDDLADAVSDVRACVHAPLTDNQAAALVSFDFNTGGLCGSTLARMANAGAPATQWCPQLMRWVNAGGKRVQGLVNRRTAETQLCLKGA